MIQPVLIISVCFQADDPPFISGVNGRTNIYCLQEIERQILDDESDEPFNRGYGEYYFHAKHVDGQYGLEGRCEIAPYWMFDLLSFQPDNEV